MMTIRRREAQNLLLCEGVESKGSAPCIIGLPAAKFERIKRPTLAQPVNPTLRHFSPASRRRPGSVRTTGRMRDRHR